MRTTVAALATSGSSCDGRSSAAVRALRAWSSAAGYYALDLSELLDHR